MAQDIPLLTSVAQFRVTTQLTSPYGGSDGVTFDFKWNTRDESWYFDILDEDLTPIFTGRRLVLGVNFGRWFKHKLLRDGIFVAIDTSRTHTEAGFDDLGQRVILRYYTVFDVMNGTGTLPTYLDPSDEQTDE